MRYDGTYDFSGHNMNIITKIDENGEEYKEVEFDTDAFGTFFEVSIEKINDVEYIVASCEIWKRFSRACEIIINRIQSGTLHTSWEISIEKSHQGIVDGLMTKIVDVGRFIGHCLLGENVSPAYDSSGLLEIASTNYDMEFAEALSQDIINCNLNIEENKKEEESLKGNVKTNVDEDPIQTSTAEATAQVVSNVNTDANQTSSSKETDVQNNVDTVSAKNTETSALTSEDLRWKIQKACRDKYDAWVWVSYLFPEEHEVWCEYDGETTLDYLRFTYSVENDEVVVSDPEKVMLTVSVKDINTTVSEYEKIIADKDELIVNASSEINSLKTQNTELSQYKEKFTQMEQEKVAAELLQKKEALIASVIKSGQITRDEIEKSEELSGYVDNLDKKSLMAIVGERLSASMETKQEQHVENSNKNVATSEHVVSNLNEDDETDVSSVASSIMKNFLGM